MRFRVLLFVCALAALARPALAISVGERLPAPPDHAVDGAALDTQPWQREGVVVWYLFDPAAPDAAEALRWLAASSAGRGGYRAVGIPVGDASGLDAQGVPLLANGPRWRPQLGPGTTPPLLLLTRPPGRVAGVRDEGELAKTSYAAYAVTVHMHREDWPAVLELVERGGEPLLDPVLRAARGEAAMGAGDGGSARYEADGLGRVGPTAAMRGVGHALQAELARRAGNLDAAQSAAASGDVGELLAVQAKLALTRGDTAGAEALARRAIAAAALPWSPGLHTVLAANAAMLRGRDAEARELAEEAVRRAPASWRAWQTLGLLALRAGDTEGADLLEVAAVMAPPDVRADLLARTARAFVAGAPAGGPPDAVVILEAGSVPHVDWPGAGATATALFAEAYAAVSEAVVQAYALSPAARAADHPFGDPLAADAALAAAQRIHATHLILLRMHAGDRGVFLNARTVDTDGGALLSVESMVWTPDLTLDEACRALAERVLKRL